MPQDLGDAREGLEGRLTRHRPLRAGGHGGSGNHAA
jgi:hypothetical protein